MPSTTPDYTIQKYTTTLDFPDIAWKILCAHERNANVILPHAENCHALERAGARFSSQQLWITCTTFHQDTVPSIDFILSCVDGPLGTYPIFIVTTLYYSQLATERVYRRLQSMAFTLQATVPTPRVYALFAPEPVTRMFAAIWSGFTGVPLEPQPEYYAAKITYCTRASFRNRQMSVFPGLEFVLRPAVPLDLPQVAQLFSGFSAESPPYVLNEQGSITESSLLIQKGQVWVHEVRIQDRAPEIASVVAITRTSDTVATVTKVYTHPNWRKRGCAERLTRRVVGHLLKTKESVALYVAHSNPAAAKVYSRVGFVGLDEESGPVDGVDSWLELGFDRRYVQLGHCIAFHCMMTTDSDY